MPATHRTGSEILSPTRWAIGTSVPRVSSTGQPGRHLPAGLAWTRFAEIACAARADDAPLDDPACSFDRLVAPQTTAIFRLAIAANRLRPVTMSSHGAVALRAFCLDENTRIAGSAVRETLLQPLGFLHRAPAFVAVRVSDPSHRVVRLAAAKSFCARCDR